MSLATAVTPFKQWLPANQSFYGNFRQWLHEGGYGRSAIYLYGLGARLALGILDKPYWLIDPDADADQVQAFLVASYPCEGTRSSYAKGLLKLQQYLRQRCQRPQPARPIHWPYYLATLPAWLGDDVRAYLSHCRRAWPPDAQYRRTLGTLSRLTRSLRWLASHSPLATIADITPAVWLDYLDSRLAANVEPVTLNTELQQLQPFLAFLREEGRPVCERMLRVEPLATRERLPRDVGTEQLARLLAAIEIAARSPHAGVHRTGLLDRAWSLLMLHSGLRTGEVRRLRLADLDLARRQARIERAKGLKDRVVCLSETTIQALRAYLAVRGPGDGEHVFLYRHLPLSPSYCSQRLRTYAERCGVRVTPHQLRHSCATLLLNAGAPILTVQAILGHKHIDTTLGYARLYDGTLAADYYRAMASIEQRLQPPETEPGAPSPAAGSLLALLDALGAGTLDEAQREIVQALRTEILALAPVNTPG